MNHHSSSGQNVLRVGNWWRYLVSRHPTRCLFIHQLLRKGANVRLLGLVIQRAAGAVPDKAHANAVEAWAYHKRMLRHLKRFQMASPIAMWCPKSGCNRACDSIHLLYSLNDKESMARMRHSFPAQVLSSCKTGRVHSWQSDLDTIKCNVSLGFIWYDM